MNEIVGTFLLLAIGLAAWYVKFTVPKLIENKINLKYEKELENFKQDLKAEKDKEIEHFKSQLTITSNQTTFQFSKNFEKYSEVYATIYIKAIEAQQAAAAFILFNEGQTKENADELFDEYDKRIIDFNKYVGINAIYLRKETEIKITRLIQTTSSAVVAYKRLTRVSAIPNASVESIENLRTNFEKVSAQMMQITDDIKMDFRKGLGLE